MSLVWRSCLVSCSVFFLVISIHLIMHKLLSLQPCWPGQFFTMPLVALCVFGVFGVWFCLRFVCFCFCFVFCLFFRHRDGPIGPCRGPPIVRPLLIHLLTKMAELPTALINGQHTACKSVLIDLAKAKRRWTGKKRVACLLGVCIGLASFLSVFYGTKGLVPCVGSCPLHHVALVVQLPAVSTLSRPRLLCLAPLHHPNFR